MAAEVKAKFEGSWKVYKSENWEAFLDAMEVAPERKKMMLTASPVHDITVDGDSVTYVMSVGAFKTQGTFVIGKEVEVKMEVVAKVFCEYKDGKLITISTPADKLQQQQKTIREIVNGEMVQTMTSGNVVCTRYFKRN